MKNIVLFAVLALTINSCSTSKVTTTTSTSRYTSLYNSYLEEGETEVYRWYQGITSKNDKEEYIIRLFYPEKKQITSLITYKVYNKSIKHGLYKKWVDNGHLTSEGYYEDDDREGLWKFYSNRTGKLTSEGNYEAGEREGLWKYYAENGTVSDEISWVEGVKEGVFTEYDTLGNLINEGIHKADTIFEQSAESDIQRKYENGTIYVLVEEMPYLKEVEHIEDIVERKKASDQLLLEYIYNNVKYPVFARENATEGLAVLSFTVMEDGRIEDVYTISGICESIEAECRRIVNNMPQWNPGRQKGEAVRVKYNLPIRFKLT